MTEAEINYHISRLVADCELFKIRGESYLLRTPSRYKRHLAEIIYQEVYEEFNYNSTHNQESLGEFLKINNIWNHLQEQALGVMRDDLNKLKIELYKKNLPIVREALKKGKEKIGQELLKKHQYDRLTSEWAAQDAKEHFLVGCGIYRKGWYWKNPLEDWKSSDHIVDHIFNMRSVLNETQLRAIVKSKTWKTYLIKGTLINRPIVDMSEELRELLNWGQLYSSIYKHSECPPEDVLEDDDRLDGWLLTQKDKQKQSKLEQKKTALVDKHHGAGEIYVLPSEINEESEFTLEEIDKLNTEEAKRIRDERLKVVRERGRATDMDFKDVRNQHGLI